MVLDVHLPDIDGFELCRRAALAARRPRALPVLHLSAAFVTDEDKVRGLDAGADAYLTHPVEPAVLVATVQALVRTRVAEDAMRRSEAKFRAIYAQAPSGIACSTSEGRFVDANPALLLLLARRADDVVGHRVSGVRAAPEWTRARRALPAADRRRRSASPNSRWSTPTGEPVHLQWSVSAHIEPGVSMVGRDRHLAARRSSSSSAS